MDKYKIKITSQAKDHLRLIQEYIAIELKVPSIAKKMLELLKSEMYSLETMPNRIKCIDEKPWQDLGFRKIRVKNYYIYFWIDDKKKEVHIVAIIYVKMDQGRQLIKLCFITSVAGEACDSLLINIQTIIKEEKTRYLL